MADALDADILQIVGGEIGQYAKSNIVLVERIGVLAQAQLFQP